MHFVVSTEIDGNSYSISCHGPSSSLLLVLPPSPRVSKINRGRGWKWTIGSCHCYFSASLIIVPDLEGIRTYNASSVRRLVIYHLFINTSTRSDKFKRDVFARSNSRPEESRKIRCIRRYSFFLFSAEILREIFRSRSKRDRSESIAFFIIVSRKRIIRLNDGKICPVKNERTKEGTRRSRNGSIGNVAS